MVLIALTDKRYLLDTFMNAIFANKKSEIKLRKNQIFFFGDYTLLLYVIFT